MSVYSILNGLEEYTPVNDFSKCAFEKTLRIVLLHYLQSRLLLSTSDTVSEIVTHPRYCILFTDATSLPFLQRHIAETSYLLSEEVRTHRGRLELETDIKVIV